MLKFDAGDLMIDAVVDFFEDAAGADFVTNRHAVFMPNPNILFVHEKFTTMTWLDITEKCPPKSGFGINKIFLDCGAALFSLRLLAQNA
jgi:hypothetical protein